jgi:hypothetical protein
VSANPYESPSTAVFEEAQHARAVLDATQQRVVERFVRLNRRASTWMIGVGCLVGVIIPTFMVIVRDKFFVPTGVGFVALGIPLVVLGIFQRRPNIVAISLTCLVTVSAFSVLAFGLVVYLRERMSDPMLDWKGKLESLPLLGLLCLAAWGLVFIPAWLAVRAWQWRMQGIDLTALEKIEYRQAGDHRDAPAAFPRGDT